MEEEKEEEEKAEKAEEQMFRTPSKKADDKNKASVGTADKTASVDKLQQKQQTASGTYFADKAQGLAHDVGDGDDGDASPAPALKKPKMGSSQSNGAGTEAPPKAPPKAPLKAQPKAQEEQQPKNKKTKR